MAPDKFDIWAAAVGRLTGKNLHAHRLLGPGRVAVTLYRQPSLEMFASASGATEAEACEMVERILGISVGTTTPPPACVEYPALSVEHQQWRNN